MRLDIKVFNITHTNSRGHITPSSPTYAIIPNIPVFTCGAASKQTDYINFCKQVDTD